MKHSRTIRALAFAGIAILLLLPYGIWCWRHCRVPAGVQCLGKITEPALHQCSGVAVSRHYADVFWVHNDSGNPEVLYAITRTGALIGKWRVTGRRFFDWEDIALDDAGNLFLADTGNNRMRRRTVSVHRVKEPDPAKREEEVAIEYSWRLQYPNGPRDAESLFLLGNNGFLVTKRPTNSAEVYRFPLTPTTNILTLELVAELSIGTSITGAAVSPDGKVLALVSPVGAFAYRIDGDVSRVQRLTPHLTKFKNLKIEGCTFTPEGLLTTSETRGIHLFTNDVFRVK
jgi:hypothetical protein